uniref:Major facilitator superfamily (MFS) profile domain-containing protein n=1 Tax=Salix viminalis TaxID=40686 RepID=A0A6N2LKN4_SALVM
MEKLAELSHLFVTVFLSSFASLMVIPAITDVTMSAVCPGKDECSLAIYLSGFQQAIIGLGTVVMMPLIGNLSDQYGRKALLTLPMTLSIIPLVILAYSRTTTFFYAYYLLRTLTAMICEGSINCLALAYVADNVLERQRTSAFGILSGIATSAFVCGTLAARFLSTASTFQVAALVSMLAAVYMRIFLRESLPNGENLTRPILKSGQDGHCQDDGDLSRLAPLVFMPLLTQLVAEEKLLAIGLLGGIADVPYATTMFAVFMVFVPPCLRSIASKQVGPTEQGKAQGCISGIISFAKIISPLIYSPLTALFLSEDAPFHFPGFSILCIGFATMIAFFQSVLMRGAPPISSHKISNSLLA